jgi:hypothetical protein
VFESLFWEPALRAAYGRRLKYAGRYQRTFKKEYLSATPDGLLVGLADDALMPFGIESLSGDRSLLIECKTIHCYPNSTWPDGPKPAHVYQVQVGLGMIHESTRHRPEYALISYTNASDWADTREFAIKRDPAIFTVAQRRAEQVLTAKSAEALLPEGLTSGGRECKWCPYSEACLGTESMKKQVSKRRVEDEVVE